MSSPSGDGGGNLTTGTIAGIVVGTLAFVFLIGAAVWVFFSRRSMIPYEAPKDKIPYEAPKDKLEMVNPISNRMRNV